MDVLPLTQVIVVTFETGFEGEVIGAVVTAEGAALSWLKVTLIVGLENMKLEADIRNQPVEGSSVTIVVATLLSPLSLAIETVALIGAFVKL